MRLKIVIGDMAPWFGIHNVDDLADSSTRLEGAEERIYLGGNIERASELVTRKEADPYCFKFFRKYTGWDLESLTKDFALVSILNKGQLQRKMSCNRTHFNSDCILRRLLIRFCTLHLPPRSIEISQLSGCRAYKGFRLRMKVCGDWISTTNGTTFSDEPSECPRHMNIVVEE
jgi:hypothetical protein